jgi:hypothetical protein
VLVLQPPVRVGVSSKGKKQTIKTKTKQNKSQVQCNTVSVITSASSPSSVIVSSKEEEKKKSLETAL